MTEKKAVFTAIAEIVEVPNTGPDAYHNPYLTMAKFIFADDKGNENNQGIEYEDFDEVAKTAIDMPVKMNFTGKGVANHLGSYVIGHIRQMDKVQAEDGTNQLMASAVLYAEEYPDEVTYLKNAHAAGEAPGISYEIAYHDSVIKNGIQWIKGLITCAATFVRDPAYGQRTALLALASAKDDTEFLETMRTLVAQAEENTGEGSNPNNKGGNNVDELEKAKTEAAQYKAEAETKSAEIASLKEQLVAKDTEISNLTNENTTLKREATLEQRIRKFTEAGFTLEADAEKADKRKALWLSLSDDGFDAYLEDLVETAKKSSLSANPTLASAARKLPQVPKLEIENPASIPSFKMR